MWYMRGTSSRRIETIESIVVSIAAVPASWSDLRIASASWLALLAWTAALGAFGGVVCVGAEPLEAISRERRESEEKSQMGIWLDAVGGK